MHAEKFFPTLFQHLATDTARNLGVSAGADAGKTAVLTRRMIKILREQRLPLDSLMVVTFTDKAAVDIGRICVYWGTVNERRAERVEQRAKDIALCSLLFAFL